MSKKSRVKARFGGFTRLLTGFLLDEGLADSSSTILPQLELNNRKVAAEFPGPKRDRILFLMGLCIPQVVTGSRLSY